MLEIFRLLKLFVKTIQYKTVYNRLNEKRGRQKGAETKKREFC